MTGSRRRLRVATRPLRLAPRRLPAVSPVDAPVVLTVGEVCRRDAGTP